MILRILMWKHRRAGHTQMDGEVTIGIHDTSLGILRKCSCGEMWAL